MPYIFDAKVVAQKLYDPAEYRSSLDGAVLEAVLKNNTPTASVRYPVASIPDYLGRAFTNNYADVVDKYKEYYANNHSDTIPKGMGRTFQQYNVPGHSNYVAPPEALKTVIEGIAGEPVKILYYFYNIPINWILSKKYLLANPTGQFKLYSRGGNKTGYVVFTDIFSGKVYVIRRHVHTGTELKVICQRIESVTSDVSWAGSGYGTSSEMATYTFDLQDIYPIIPSDVLHQAVYETISTRDLGVFLYKEGLSGGYPNYPELDDHVDYFVRDTTCYPFAMLVDEGKQAIKGTLGEDYKIETEKALEKLGLSLQGIMDALSEDTRVENDTGSFGDGSSGGGAGGGSGDGGSPTTPDSIPDGFTELDEPVPLAEEGGDINKDITDAFVLFAADIASDSNGELQYVYEHFRRYYINNNLRQDEAHAFWVSNSSKTWEERFLSYYDKKGSSSIFNNNRVQFSIQMQWMTIREKTGDVTKDVLTSRPSNAYLSEATYTPNGSLLIDRYNKGNLYTAYPGNNPDDENPNRIEVGKIVKYIFKGDSYEDDLDTAYATNDHVYILRKQLTAGTEDSNGNTIVAPTYVEIVVMGLVHATTISNPNDWGRTQYVKTDIVELKDGSTTEYIDVQAGKFFIPVSPEIMGNFNPIVRSEILYHTLTVALHFYTKTHIKWYMDKEFWFIVAVVRIFIAVVTWGTSEAIIQTVWAAVQEIVKQVIVSILIAKGLELVVDMIGGEAALIIAAIAAVVSIYANGGGTAFDGLLKLLNADQLMQAATGLITAVNESVVEDSIELQEEIREFLEEQKERDEELAALKAELNTGTTINYVDVSIRQPLPDFHETPTNFYNRTIHLTNPGVLSLDVIDSYVGNALTLPKFPQ